MLMQRLSETFQILWAHMNETATRAVNVRYEHERDRHNYWKNEEQNLFPFRAPRTVADQEVGANGDDRHQSPFPYWYAVPKAFNYPQIFTRLAHRFFPLFDSLAPGTHGASRRDARTNRSISRCNFRKF